jgi:hypothetical protein
MRWSLAVVLGGGAVGAAIGAAGMPTIAGSETTAAGLALGAASCGVMSGWLALLVGNFWATSRRAWREANADGETSAPRPRRRWALSRRRMRR